MTQYGMLSTYPPTQCGLATFSAALVGSLCDDGDVVQVVAAVDSIETGFPHEVRQQWVRDDAGGARAAAARLNTCDVAIVQHEYGIFGGPDGVDVLDVVRALSVPTIIVFHTVLTAPTRRQRMILVELARNCEAIVTMTWTARQRLIAHYGIDADLVTVIPHGADDTHVRDDEPPTRHPDDRPVILTWGLLGSGKGIEWGIEAMALLRDVHPAPEYHIVGETHPKVAAHEGQAYRRRLESDVQRLDLGSMVSFDDRYLTVAELQRIVHAADFVLLPYDSRDQVTSGVLVEAITAGKPVISTGFPHAVELLGAGMGILVPRSSPRAIADAVRLLIDEPGQAARMSEEARAMAPELLWPAVAARYRDLATEITPVTLIAVGA